VSLVAVLQACETDHVREQAVRQVLENFSQKDSTYAAVAKYIKSIYGDSINIVNNSDLDRMGLASQGTASINLAEIYKNYWKIKSELESLGLQKYVIPLDQFAYSIAAQELFHISGKGHELENMEEAASDIISIEQWGGAFYLYMRIKEACRYYAKAAKSLDPNASYTLDDLATSIGKGYEFQIILYISMLIDQEIPEQEIIDAGASDEAFKEFMKKYPDLLERLSK